MSLKVCEAWSIFYLEAKSFNHFPCGIEILDCGFRAVDLLNDFDVCFGVQKFFQFRYLDELSDTGCDVLLNRGHFLKKLFSEPERFLCLVGGEIREKTVDFSFVNLLVETQLELLLLI